VAESSRDQDLSQHLSRISTMWTVLFDAHGGSAHAVAAAQEKLLRRYSGAVYRYLVSVTRDVNTADELAQEFALAFLRGGFRGANPEKGRFRDYVKASLFNLIRSFHKQRQRQQLGADLADVEEVVSSASDEETFLQGWRDEVLAGTWEALSQFEVETGRLYHTLLKYRARHTDTSSADMAEVLTKQLGKPLTAANVRQTIHRAREKFGELLIDEVAQSLGTSDLDQVEQELLDLGLHTYCGDALQRWKANRSG
jgi:RNA polymerase sigma-70 factor (ECF subfamily)